jgi:hypothetical protein
MPNACAHRETPSPSALGVENYNSRTEFKTTAGTTGGGLIQGEQNLAKPAPPDIVVKCILTGAQ